MYFYLLHNTLDDCIVGFPLLKVKKSNISYSVKICTYNTIASSNHLQYLFFFWKTNCFSVLLCKELYFYLLHNTLDGRSIGYSQIKGQKVNYIIFCQNLYFQRYSIIKPFIISIFSEKLIALVYYFAKNCISIYSVIPRMVDLLNFMK